MGVGSRRTHGRSQGCEARRQQLVQQSAGSRKHTQPLQDPMFQAGAEALGLGSKISMLVGEITDCTSYASAYRVQFEQLHKPVVAYLAPRTSLAAFGARDIGSLLPGTKVLVALHNQLSIGWILCALPPSQLALNKVLNQVLSQTTRQRVDSAHAQPLKMAKNGKIADKLMGRLVDGLMAGEQGWITETGMRIFVDSFMAQVALDELTGLFIFFHDNLVRLGGQNMQIRTSGYERDMLLDQDEIHDYEGFALYPWEQYGLFERGDPRRELSDDEWQKDESYYGKWEPKDDRQQPFHRVQRYHGYLGQGGKYLVSSKPKEGTQFTYASGESDDDCPVFPGLFDWTVLADGRSLMQSAKGISIVKRPGIIVPVRRRRCEQSTENTGDCPDNYRFSGHEALGSGEEHTITGDLAVQGEAEKSLQLASGVLDMHAYMFNYAGVHPFFWHGKDWKLTEEEELPTREGAAKFIPNFKDLDKNTFLETSEPVKIDVDHRMKQQDIYQTESGLVLLDDGGVALYDGYGGEIRMTAGSVWISAPGDVWLKSGRDTIQWAGGDCIVSGRNNVEINATHHDVRIKGQKNVQVTAADGGLMFESRATTATYDFSKAGTEAVTAGILFKSKQAPIAMWGKQIYFGTGRGEVERGSIMFDAAGGAESVYVYADSIMNYVKGSIFNFFGEDAESCEAANEFSKAGCYLSGRLGVSGTATFNGNLMMKGSILVAEGHILTQQAKTNMYVSPLEGKGLDDVVEFCRSIEQRVNTDLPQQGQQIYTRQINSEDGFYGEKCCANEEVIKKAEFTWRTVDQMRTTDWKLFEDRWQQLARLSESVDETWAETPIETQVEGEMYPYPGKEAWTGKSGFFQQELAIFDAENGYSRKRGSDGELNSEYKDGKIGETKEVALSDNYLVTRSKQ